MIVVALLRWDTYHSVTHVHLRPSRWFTSWP